jgi:hypothetical protein
MKLFNRHARRGRTSAPRRPRVDLRFDVFEDRLLLTSYVVNSAADTNTGTNNDGTLRYVLNQLSATGTATNEIDFNIAGSGVQTIVLGSDLPTITRQATINGYTETGSSANNQSVGTNAVITVQLSLNGHAGLIFNAGSADSVVEGLAIFGGSAAGISVDDNSVTVSGDFLGVQADGATAGANAIGVSVASGISGVQIGTATLADRNLISGNTSAGVSIAGTAQVQGNLIGTDRTGLVAVPNQVGIAITGAGTQVGGAVAAAGNVISGNTSQGVSLSGASSVAVLGNLIGLKADDSGALANGGDGVLIDTGSTNSSIGGTTSGAGNVIDGSGTAGIGISGSGTTGNVVLGNLIGTDSSGANLGNADGVEVSGGASSNTIGGTTTGAGNTIGFNTQQGVLIVSGTKDFVHQNLYLGTNGPNSPVQSNDIVLVPGANNNQPAPGLRATYLSGANLVAEVTGVAAGTSVELYQLTTGSPAQRTFLGTGTVSSVGGILTVSIPQGAVVNGDQIVATASSSANGSSAFSGAQTVADLFTVINTNSSGVGSLYQVITNANDHPGLNTITFAISGPLIIHANSALPVPAITDPVVIDGTSEPGVIIDGSGLNQDGLVLKAGSSGSTIKGLTIRNFQGSGISILSSGNTIGGAGIAANAVYSDTTGILISGSSAQNNLVENNFIGTDSSLANLGNVYGLEISQTGGNTIGAGGLANQIDWNTGAGILISGPAPSGNTVIGNLIGTDGISGLANGYGVQILNSHGNTIGGTTSNTIGFNAQQGVSVLTGNQNLITRNLYLGGNPPPVPGSDITVGSGANNGIVAPVLTSASLDQTLTNLTISVSQSPASGSQPVALEVYVFTTAQRVFKFTIPNVTLTATPTLITVPNSASLNLGDTLVVTATDSLNDTSAFSNTAQIAHALVVTNTNDSGSGSLRAALLVAAGTSGATVSFDIPGSGPFVITLLTPLAAITSPVTIDGTSEPNYAGAPLVEIVGTNLSSSATALELASGSDGSEIRGLELLGFGGSGISVESNNDKIDANVIGSNAVGVVLSGNSNLVFGNLVGTNSSSPRPNLSNTVGVSVVGTGNTIGGTAANTFGFNATSILITSTGTGNTISSNDVGTDSAGDDLGTSSSYGVRVLGTGNTIGGSSGTANTIGFNNTGVSLEGPGNQVLGNFVGTSASGLPLGNAIGISVSATNNTIGGSTADIIGFNSTAGIAISASGTIVVGEFIGTNSAGSNLGNSVGVAITGSTNTIGGTTSAAANVIGFNTAAGVQISGGGAGSNVVEGDLIGTNTIQDVLSNGVNVLILGGLNNTIGGTASGAGNTIGFGSTFGVSVASGSGNVVLANQYKGNATLESSSASDIALAPGANNGQIPPTIDSASLAGTQLNISLHFANGYTGPVQIDLYQDSSPGKRVFLQTVSLSSAPYAAQITTSGLTSGDGIIATATVPGNGTSVFSTFVPAAGPTVVTNTEDYAANGTPIFGSLRYAISQATSSNPDITFAIASGTSPFVIALVAPIDINVPVTIDGTTQNGYTPNLPVIEVSGKQNGQVTDTSDGLVLAAGSGGSTIEGLIIAQFTGGAGIHIETDGNTIINDYIGVDPANPKTSLGNLLGVWIDGSQGSAQGSTIGGSAAGDANVIGYNTSAGVSISGTGATGNSVLGNFIGTDPQGLYNLGNASGLAISSNGNLVGASRNSNLTYNFSPNVIGDNTVSGVSVSGDQNLLLGNFIGTNSALSKIGNAVGIQLSGGDNSVGATNSGAANTIGFNNGPGISIGGSAATGNLVGGNFIGTDAMGDSLGNSGAGIVIGGGSSNTIGALTADPTSVLTSLTPGVANLIVGNSGDGVLILPAPPTDPAGNPIHSDDNQVQGNLISRNAANGVHVQGITWKDNQGTAHVADPLGNQIIQNFIGTTADGKSAYQFDNNGVLESQGNLLSGVLLETYGAGTSATVSGNVISGNGLSGVTIDSQNPGHVTPDTNNPLPAAYQVAVTISHNMIGLDQSGQYSVGFAAPSTQALPIGNVLDGILIDNVMGVTVGATTSGSAPPSKPSNVISGNLGRGVEIRGDLLSGQAISSLSLNLVEDNFIGTDSGGTNAVSAPKGATTSYSLGNLSDGVFLFVPQATDIVGNLISGNRADGIHAATQQQSGGTTPGSTVTGALSIQGNYIGTDVSGTSTNQPNTTPAISLGNGSDGIFLDSLSGGVTIGGSGSATVGGLVFQQAANVISGNRANGIDVLDSSSIDVLKNFVGTDKAGTLTGLGNSSNGIFINGGDDNTIGAPSTLNADGSLITNPDGSLSFNGNVISGNSASGILISAPQTGSSTGTIISGNVIGLGLDKNLSTVIPNQVAGVVISNATGNLIGGTNNLTNHILTGNFISGNRLYGVEIADATSGNTVAGNYIGTNAQDLADLGNTSDGVFVLNSKGTTIGGAVLSTASAANVIAGNRGNGVQVFGTSSTKNTVTGNMIGVGADGTMRIPNGGNGIYLNNAGDGIAGDANVIGPGNVVSGNNQSGVMIFGTQNSGGSNTVAGNLIGTDESGTQAIPNGGNGVFIYGTSNNTIGGSLSGTQNVISGNAQSGILIFSPNTSAPADSNFVQGNLIGTDRSGSAAVPNHADGVQIINSNSNTVGGTSAQARNVISGNLASGVEIDVLTTKNTNIGLTASNNLVTGNYIGTNAAGAAALSGSTQLYGLLVNNALNNTIGATNGATVSGTNTPVSPSNVISGNLQAGIDFTGASSGNQVLGNFIGVDKNGLVGPASAALGNSVGVVIDNTSGNAIGGDSGGAGNIISESPVAGSTAAFVGILIQGPPGNNPGTTVEGNLIGLDIANRPAANQYGVEIVNSSMNSIGGLTGGLIGGASGGIALYRAGNIISANNTAGVAIIGQTSILNRIQGNFIGTDVSGTRLITATGPMPYDAYAVRISSSTDNLAHIITPIQTSGVLINQASFNTIGGGTLGSGNLISGNQTGIDIEGVAGDSTKGASNVISGNFIGTDVSGSTSLPNFEYGVYISGSPKNQVANNLISGNGVAGIDIFGGASQSQTAPSLGNLITSNLIGTDIHGNPTFATTNTYDMVTFHPTIYNDSHDGNKAHDLPSYLGFQLNGVVVIGSAGNFIGGPTKSGGNLISGNILTGVYLTSHDFLGNTYAQPVANIVENNQIVRDGMYGVYLYDAPEGANSIILTGSRANTITGSPISIGTFVTGVSSQVPAQPNPQSIFLPSPFGVPTNPFAQPALGSSGTGTKKVTPGGKHKPAPKVHHRVPKSAKHAVTRPVRNTPHGVSTKATAVNRVVSRPKVPVLIRSEKKSVLVRHPAIRRDSHQSGGG